MESYSVFMDWITEYGQIINSFQLDWKIHCNPNQNPSNLLCGYFQTDSKVHENREKTQYSQFNIEEDK